MFLRATLTAAVLLAGAPALAASGADSPSHAARAEKNATTRCTMQQLHIPAGRGLGASGPDCVKVARDVAALHEQQTLAAREAPSHEGRD